MCVVLPISVWNDGASAEISHTYFPEIDGSTDLKVIKVRFVFCVWKRCGEDLNMN